MDMATASMLPYQKRKQNTYGKPGSSSKSAYNTSRLETFFNDGEEKEDDEHATSKPTSEPQSNAKDAYTGQRTEVKPSRLKAVKPRSQKINTFDVPSSDDETGLAFRPRPLPATNARRRLIDDTASREKALAPWEKKRAGAPQPGHQDAARHQRETPCSPDAQLRQELDAAAFHRYKGQGALSTLNHDGTAREREGAMNPSDSSANNGSMGAAARLAARRKAVELVSSSGSEPAIATRMISKRSVEKESENLRRKRARTASGSSDAKAYLSMANSTLPLPSGLSEQMGGESAQRTNELRLSDSSSQEDSKTEAKLEETKMMAKSGKRRKPRTESGSTLQNGVSAPARLAGMLATDTKSPNPANRPPSTPSSRNVTPHPPSTPSSGPVNSPSTAIKATGSATPKQMRLWDQALLSDQPTTSPSSLPLKKLRISSKRIDEARSGRNQAIAKSKDTSRRRTRLVDRLKASAHTSDDDSDDDDDTEMPSVSLPDQTNIDTSRPENSTRFEQEPARASQSQTYAGTSQGGGPKITYSRMRSYLPEDNPEDDLMFGLAGEVPQASDLKAHHHGKPAPASQKSALDFEESDEEAGGMGRIRTIHELRASSRNVQGMYDIEELMGDIKNHNVTKRSRRRNAFVDLATKLADKSFVERFVGHSIESQLAMECMTASDPIGDFGLAACFALLLASEPSEHTVKCLQDHGAIGWLAGLLQTNTNVSRLAKDRRNNMSKASQGSLNNLGDLLKGQHSLWAEEKPMDVTTRLIALKALEQLVGRLRRLGEKAELLNSTGLLDVLVEGSHSLSEESKVETVTAVSLLESLSTSSASLAWSPGILKRIADILPALDVSSPAWRHTLFLTLRLCLNLTSDNIRNCDELANESTVSYLLQSVRQGFQGLDSEIDFDKRALALDLLLLATGIMINLAEHSEKARQHAVDDDSLLAALVQIFRQGQEHILEAESVEESTSNVAFGYLAVMLAHLCQDAQVKARIAANLPGAKLDMLVEAVEEFVAHHQKVDTLNFDGDEGAEVWGAFTAKLKTVLTKLKEAAEM